MLFIRRSLVIGLCLMTSINGMDNACNSGIAEGNNSITVGNGSRISWKEVNLIGKREKNPFSGAIHTVCLPSSLALVIIESRENNSYIECDREVLNSELKIVVKDGRLEYSIPQNSMIRFYGTENKPLFTICTHLIDDALSAQGFANVQINTPLIRSIAASGKSEINMPSVKTKELNVTISNDSKINVQGTAKNQSLKLSGKALYKALKLRSNIATVEVSDFAYALLYVDQELSGRTLGVSTVLYKGGAQQKVKNEDISSCKELA